MELWASGIRRGVYFLPIDQRPILSLTEASLTRFLGSAGAAWNDDARTMVSELARDGVCWVTALATPPDFPHLFDQVKGRSVLSLGSLEGNLEWHLAAAGASRVVGVEGYFENFRKCLVLRALFPTLPIEFVLGDARQLDGIGTFDVIVCAGLLYHLHDPAAFLEQLRALRPWRLFVNTQTAVDRTHPAFGVHALGPRGEIHGKRGTYRGRWYSDARQHIYDYRCGIDGRESFWFYPEEVRRLIDDLDFEIIHWKVADFDDQGRIVVAELASREGS